MSKVRMRLSDEQAQLVGIVDFRPKDKDGRNPRYSLSVSQVETLNNELIVSNKTIQDETTYSEAIVETDAFKQYCIDEGIDIKRVKSAKFVNHQSQQKFNIVLDYDNKEKEDIYALTEETITRIVKKHAYPISLFQQKKKTRKNSFLQVVITDTHIGMDVTDNGRSLYGGKWDRHEILSRADVIIEEAKLLSDKYDEVHLIDLGDLADGFKQQTARGGHELPQNMDTETIFDVAIEFKMKLINAFVREFKEVKVFSVSNDNHAGTFAYIINSATKNIVNAIYPNVEMRIDRRFINHYISNSKVFIYSHGKDDKHLKFGFKPHLDSKGKDKIEEYMKSNNLMGRGYEVFFYKGDSHQMLLDYSSSDDFNYFNFPALSPSSDWIQHNFKKGKSGFIIIEHQEETHRLSPYFFKWNN